MTEKSNIPQDPMEQWIGNAVDAIRQTPAPPMPPAVQAAAVAKMQQAARQPRIILLYERIRAMKPRNKFVAAASFLIALGGAIAMVAVMTGRPAVAFADVKAQLQQAKSIQMTLSMATPGTMGLSNMRMKMFIKEPGLVRVEMDAATTILDIPAKKMLVLDVAKKEATVVDIGQFPAGANTQPQNMLENIRKYLDGTEKPLGERQIDGKPAEGFCVTKDTGEMEIWADKAGGNLVMVKIAPRLAGAALPSVILRDIVVNPDLPDAMFSFTPPQGYKSKAQQMLNLSQPAEGDLVAGLAMMASIQDGRFPDNISAGPELGSEVERAAKDMSEPEQQAMTQKLVRMLLFSVQQKHFQYAGKGVKLGEAAKPIAWWLKNDGANYRAVMGDLTLKDMPAGELPAAANQPTSAPCTAPAGESGPLRVQIIDQAGSDMSVGALRPDVVVRVEKNAATQPAQLWTKGVGEFSDSTSQMAAHAKTANLVVRIDDPRGQRANLPVSGPVKVAVYDSEAGTVAAVDDLSAGDTLTIKPAPGGKDAANPEFVAELRDAQGKTKDVTGAK